MLPFQYMIRLKKIGKIVLLVLAILVLLLSATVAVIYAFSTPSNDRDWTIDQQVLPSVTFDAGTVTVRNIRDFEYTSETEYTPRYYDRTYTLNEITSVDFIVEPLASIAIAHTFLSFGFKSGDYVSVSVEIRKEKGESFSPTKGLLDQFELMYVVADERDVVRLRALHRKDILYLYPLRVSPEKAQELFVSMMTRIKSLEENPEFYNTLTNTCTTNIVDHVNTISENKIPWDFRILFPKDSDEFAYDLGLIDTNVPLEILREKHQINALVEKYQNGANFSQKIREYLH
jgi:hypothetical protein